MAKIPLRVYNREIENLIDRGQTEEALARCKQILQIFPKYIETYRLLGKVYLESQRYTEAADVFQRLLSTVPDDFIAHVGMSIIKEDEGNLDGAIWHMERATEIQPSNTAVQDELRRLFSRREGMEPSRLRMTRGGLVRMYARGDLYQQAITEALAALAEDPQRTDIQVVLARMYNLTGQRVKAAEVCKDLLEKLPYCYEANLILHEILPDTTRTEESDIYLERACELDPYVAHLKNDQTDPGDVPDNAIIVDRLDWDPSKVVSTQPDWASSLGIKLDGKAPEGHVLPDWLASLSPIPTQPDVAASSKGESPFFDDQNAAAMENTTDNPEDSSQASEQGASNKVSGSENLPDWMQEAGWEISNQPRNQEVSAFKFDEVEKEIPEAVPAAEIPDWLKPLAPVEPDIESTPSETSPQGELEGLAWVQALASTPVEAVPEQAHEPVEEIKPEEILPTPTPVEPPIESQIPATPEEPIAATPVVDETPAPPEIEALEIPVSQNIETATPVENEEVPDWLKGLEEAFPQAEQASTPALLPETPVTPDMPTIPGVEDQNAMMDWLEDIAIHHTAEAQTIISHPEDRISRPPSWINRMNEDGGVEQESAIPDWLQGIDEPAAFPAPSEEIEPPTPSSPEPVPDWLTDYQAPVSNQPVQPVEPALPLDMPAFDVIKPDDGVTPPAQGPETQPLNPAFDAEKPEPVAEILPAWLISLSQEPLTSIEPTSQPQEPAVAAFTPEPDLTGIDWAGLEETPSEQPAPTEQVSAPIEPFTLQPEATPAAGDDGSFDWLSAFQTTPESESETAASPEPSAKEVPSLWEPEPSFEPESTVQSVPTSDSVSGEPQEEAELPDWLKMLEEPSSEPLASGSVAESIAPTQQAYPPVIEEEASLPQELIPEIAETQAEQIEELHPIVEPAVEPESLAPAILPEIELPETEAEITHTSEPVLPVESLAEETVEEIPDWLRGFEASIQPTPQEEVSELVMEPSSDTSDIPELTQIEQGAQTEIQPEPEIVERVPQEETPAPEETQQPAEEFQVTSDLVEEKVEPTEQFEVTEIQEGEDNTVPEWVKGYLAETEKPVGEQAKFEQEPTGTEGLGELPEIPIENLPFPEPVIKVTPVDQEGEATLVMAQAALGSGNLSQALEGYNDLIRSGQMLEDTIHDLRDSLYRYPVDAMIWQSLGDAYLRLNQVQDALDAYTKAEELIR